MGDRQAKNALFDGFANVAKALGNGRRVELVDVLAQGERHVEELAVEIGQSVANTSHHLQVLAGAEVVAYCRGPYCVFADDAVRLLRRRRRNARRLQDGFPEWRTAEYPTESGLAS